MATANPFNSSKLCVYCVYWRVYIHVHHYKRKEKLVNSLRHLLMCNSLYIRMCRKMEEIAIQRLDMRLKKGKVAQVLHFSSYCSYIGPDTDTDRQTQTYRHRQMDKQRVERLYIQGYKSSWQSSVWVVSAIGLLIERSQGIQPGQVTSWSQSTHYSCSHLRTI